MKSEIKNDEGFTINFELTRLNRGQESSFTVTVQSEDGAQYQLVPSTEAAPNPLFTPGDENRDDEWSIDLEESTSGTPVVNVDIPTYTAHALALKVKVKSGTIKAAASKSYPIGNPVDAVSAH